jgi:DNA end-binding protein Ku
VIREAMRSKALVALGRIVLSKRERVIALEPYEKGLIGMTLHYPHEVRDAKSYFGDIPELTPAPELLGLAAQILDSKLQAFDPSAFRDRYEEALMAHLKAKQAGMPPQAKQSWAAPRRAINLMEALRRSIASDNKVEALHRGRAARKRA